ncbi:hypothetical protein CMUS01_08980 [Colletotrichum musicola]|uniref:BTB domain-containing protein n=1 Tax=Colletotrichum musicola TaxID=2175873 RepID=A0A8H6K9J4_9PEZI|nr:hypothetical protein CMUS01_08980 [Colletotrichum musicola]
MIYAGNTDASSIMSADLFTFIVGPENKMFQMHSALVDDCDVETFFAFSEFTYTGNYSVPEFNDIGTLNGGSPTVLGAGAVVHVDQDTPWSPGISGKSEDGVDVTPEKRRTKGYLLRLLVFHGKICRFADCHYMDDLQGLGLARLRNALDDVVLNSEGAGVIVQFLQQTYTDPPKKMKSLIDTYLGSWVEELLWDNQGFRSFVEKNGQLALDINHEVVNRLKTRRSDGGRTRDFLTKDYKF